MNINVEKRRQLSVKLLHMKTSHNGKNPYTAILSDETKKWTNTKRKKSTVSAKNMQWELEGKKLCCRDDGVHSATWRLLTNERSIEFTVVQELQKLFLWGSDLMLIWNTEYQIWKAGAYQPMEKLSGYSFFRLYRFLSVCPFLVL